MNNPSNRVPHGTYNGYAAHRRRNQKPCEPCRLAKNAYDKKIRKGDVAKRQIALNKARRQAVNELIENHRGEFSKLYLIYKEKELEKLNGGDV